MKPLSILPLISASIALCATPSHAGAAQASAKNPTPGNSQKCTRVDFDHDNNGWGNGGQGAPGNSGNHNNAANGPRSDYPGNSGNAGPPCKDASGNNNAASTKDSATQKELQRIEAEALAKIAQQAGTAKAADANAQASAVVARRAK